MENKAYSYENGGFLTPYPRIISRRLSAVRALLVLFTLKFSNVAGTATSFAAKEIGICVKESKLLPDVVDHVPAQRLFIEYGKHRVDFGTYLSPLTVEFPPTNFEWVPTRNKYYTIILTDPDFPTPENPDQREWQHWIVGNIPASDIIDGQPVGGNISEGQTLTEYFGVVSHHRFGTPHRYVFLLYEHDKVKFKEPYVKKIADDFYRAEFSSREFAKQYNLGDPLGINYFHNTRDPRRIEDNKYRKDSDEEEEEVGQMHELSLTTPKSKRKEDNKYKKDSDEEEEEAGQVHELLLTTPKSRI